MHGIKINEVTSAARAIKDAATSVIGLVATATAAAGAETDALNAAFPVNTPVVITNIRSAIGAAGSGGTLKPALEAIADQTSPVIVVVRVTQGVDAAATETNTLAGVQKLLIAEAQLGVRPRILGAPGLDTEDVASELASVAAKLRAMAYARPAGATRAEAITARAAFGSRELMLIWPDFADGFAGSAVARALGLRSRIDQEMGWHKSLSNVALDGVSGGLTTGVSFDLMSDQTDAGLLNAAAITTIVRQNGSRFWGNRTTSSDPLFAFEPAVRSSQVIQDEIAAGLAWAIDKPLTPVLVKDVVETINARLRQLVAQGRLIGARAWYDPELNPAAQLAAGKLVVDYEFTPCAPAENITLNQRITDRFYAGFADAI